MNALVQQESRALAAAPATGRMAVADIISHVATVQEVMRAVMKPEVHFGTIPGTDKPTLYKAGAEVLCMVFRIADSYQIEDLSTPDTVRYRVTCTGTHQLTGTVLGTGMGEASSGEEKYKWRKAYEPEFNETPANLRRKKAGFNKAKKEHYTTFQVRTEPADLANTILKMANKRAKMAMVLNVTAASDCFSQDLEDMDDALREHLTRHAGDESQGGQQDGGAAGAPQAPPAPPAATLAPEFFEQHKPTWRKVMASGKAKAEDVIAKVNAANPKTPLSEEQKEAIRAMAPQAATPADITDAAPKVTYAQVASQLNAAADLDALAQAASLITAVPDETQRTELNALYEQRGKDLDASN